MARPRKTGLQYFPLDVDIFEDEKIIAACGGIEGRGEIIVIKLLCAIYRNGYFMEWTDMMRYKMLRILPGVSAGLLDQVVARLLKWGFFSQSLFESANVLTSEGIQRRYFEAAKFRKIDPEHLPYLLVDKPVFYSKQNVSQTLTPISHWETPVSQRKSTQIKVKVNKKSSDEDKKGSPSPPFVEENFFNEFFSRERAGVLSRFACSLGLTDVDSLKTVAREVIDDWRLRRHVPKDWDDASSHLLSAIRKKCLARSEVATDRGDQQNSAVGMKKTVAANDLDRQIEERNRVYREREANAAKPADIIRSMGYDPDKVTIQQAFNPDWRARNPPDIHK